MRVTSRWLWVAVVALAVMSSVSLGGPEGSEESAVATGQRFIRVGDHYLNASRIDYVVCESDSLVVVFGSEAGNRLKLAGSDAAAMRRWLDERAAGQGRSQPGGYAPQQSGYLPQQNVYPQGRNQPAQDARNAVGKPQQGDFPRGPYRVVPGQTSNGYPVPAQTSGRNHP